MAPDSFRRRAAVGAVLGIVCAGLAPSTGVSARASHATIYVSARGSDRNPGTSDKPMRNLATAVQRAAPHSTIVMSAGVYRESLGTITAPVTIEAAPHATVWLSGADVVSGWNAVSGGWVHHGWTAQFCHTCYDSRALDPKYPYAGLPDMAFINGHPLAQVGHLSELRPGAFYVDYGGHNLYVGSDPTGSTVEAATRAEAARFASSAAGSVVRGIGFEKFASDWNTSPNPAMVLDEAPNMTFQHDIFTASASRGLSVYATGVKVLGSSFVANGFTGLHANKADHLDIEGNLIANNNTEKWWPGFSPVASVSGIKIASSYHVLVRGNIAQDNYSNGIWFDVSSYDATVVDNLAQRNFRNGLYIEITGTSIVASNLSIRNGESGLKLSGATDARVYNNTLADNLHYQLSVHDDGRDNADATQIKLGITWNTARNVFVNNILAAPDAGSSGPLLYTEDLDHPKSVEASTMIQAMAADVYARAGSGRPSVLAYWTHKEPAKPSRYATLAAFAKATGMEPYGVEYTGYSTSPVFTAPQHGDYSLISGSPLRGSGFPLPNDIAAVVGVPCSASSAGTGGPRSQCANRVDHGALVYP